MITAPTRSVFACSGKTRRCFPGCRTRGRTGGSRWVGRFCCRSCRRDRRARACAAGRGRAGTPGRRAIVKLLLHIVRMADRSPDESNGTAACCRMREGHEQALDHVFGNVRRGHWPVVYGPVVRAGIGSAVTAAAAECRTAGALRRGSHPELPERGLFAVV